MAVWQSEREASYPCTELTPHARTSFAVIEKFLPVCFSTSGSAIRWTVRVHC